MAKYFYSILYSPILLMNFYYLLESIIIPLHKISGFTSKNVVHIWFDIVVDFLRGAVAMLEVTRTSWYSLLTDWAIFNCKFYFQLYYFEIICGNLSLENTKDFTLFEIITGNCFR